MAGLAQPPLTLKELVQLVPHALVHPHLSASQDAFPRLLFADSLRLHHFKGTYADVLPWLVKLLGALDDHFTRILADCGGDQYQVKRRFRALGLDISPESPNTKKNAKAWEQRKWE